MRTLRGRVVEGKVVVEGEALPEGAYVAVVVGESAEDFVLTPSMEEELLEALATADNGQRLSADEVWSRLATRHT